MRICKKRTTPTRGIFIRNINYIADINDIDIFLTKYIDRYNDIMILKDRSNTFKGKIVIIFDNEQLSKNAICKLNNIIFLKRKLKVSYAYNKYIDNCNCNCNDISLINLFNNILNLT